MSAVDEDIVAPEPRATREFFGHADAERALLDAYRSGRIPHAWLIAGPRGIGKATLAYRMARFVLAHPDPKAPAVQAAHSLAVDPEHPVARHVALGAQADFLTLERTEDDKGKLRTVISVDQVRETVPFFGSTAREGGWRICLIDPVDELKMPEGANALLKVLEEPPSNSLLLLISHAPGRLLPTIRSRCRLLELRALATEDVMRAATAALGREADADVREAAALAEGSAGRAVTMLGGPDLALRRRLAQMLERLPQTDPQALHALGEAIAGTDPHPLATFSDAVNSWLSRQLASPHNLGRLARVADAYEKVNRATREVQEYNLERKPLVFSVFAELAGVAER